MNRYEMPDGTVFEVTRPGAETDGEYVEMEWTVPAGAFSPPPHVHPAQVEEYEVLEGELELMVDGEWRSLKEGESASVSVGLAHTYRNKSGEVARVRNWHRPALRFEEYIARTSNALDQIGVKSARDPRIALAVSGVMLDYGDTLAPTGPAKIPTKAFAALGRLLRLPDGT